MLGVSNLPAVGNQVIMTPDKIFLPSLNETKVIF